MHAEQVLLDHFLGAAEHRHAPGFQQDRALAECAQGIEVVADEQQCGATRQDLLDAAHRLGLERGVADRQRLVDDQDVGVDVHLHREREAQGHARAVGLDRLVDVVADVGERDDVAEQGIDARGRQAQDGAIDVDVLAPGQLWIEARAQFQQRGDPPMRFHPTRSGRQHTGNDLQQGAFAAAVEADDAQRFATLKFEIDAVERLMDMHPAASGRMQPFGQPGCGLRQQTAGPVQRRRDQALCRRGPGHEGLADVLDQDDGRACD